MQGSSGSGQQPSGGPSNRQYYQPNNSRPAGLPSGVTPPTASYARPNFSSTLKSRQPSASGLLPQGGLPHEFESHQLTHKTQQSSSQQRQASSSTQNQPHNLMPMSSTKPSSGQGQPAQAGQEELHQPFNLQNRGSVGHMAPPTGLPMRHNLHGGSYPGNANQRMTSQFYSGGQPPFSSHYGGRGAPGMGAHGPSSSSHGGYAPGFGTGSGPHFGHPYAVAPFNDEDSRRDFYKKQGIFEVPPYSTLNADVVPKEGFLGAVDEHVPKIDPDLIKDIWRTIGLQTTDERVLKVASAMMEIQMLKIINELRSVGAHAAQNQKDVVVRTNHVSFDDLSKTMEEFDVMLRRPQFIEEKQQQTAHVGQRQQAPSASFSAMYTEPQKRFRPDTGDGLPAQAAGLNTNGAKAKAT